MTSREPTPIDETPIIEQPTATETTTTVDLPHGAGRPPFTAILWDLDGTIDDSAPGITSAIADMLRSFDLPVPDQAELLTYVGPPLLEAFHEHGLDRTIEPMELITRYREIYRANGELNGVIYPGVADLLREVHARGIPQSTATSKPEAAATRILTHHGLADLFDSITGASDDETRSSKADVVAEALRVLGEQGADLSNVIMIGDRFYDVQGSGVNGVPAIYTTWGYGRLGEEQGAVGVATDAAGLRRLLGFTSDDA